MLQSEVEKLTRVASHYCSAPRQSCKLCMSCVLQLLLLLVLSSVGIANA